MWTPTVAHGAPGTVALALSKLAVHIIRFALTPEYSIRTNNTGAAHCETMAEFVGQQGLNQAGVEQMSLIYSMLMSGQVCG
jgi:hypothetical protein